MRGSRRTPCQTAMAHLVWSPSFPLNQRQHKASNCSCMQRCPNEEGSCQWELGSLLHACMDVLQMMCSFRSQSALLDCAASHSWEDCQAALSPHQQDERSVSSRTWYHHFLCSSQAGKSNLFQVVFYFNTHLWSPSQCCLVPSSHHGRNKLEWVQELIVSVIWVWSLRRDQRLFRLPFWTLAQVAFNDY